MIPREVQANSIGDQEDLVNSFLYRTVRNAAELVHADGGSISATNLVSGDTYELSHGSGYRRAEDSSGRPPLLRHTRVSVTNTKKMWSPTISFKSEKVQGALWLYRQERSDGQTEFTDEDKRAVRVLLDTAAFGLEQSMEVVRLRELLHWAGINTVKAMIHAIRAKDPYTSEHCQRVAGYSTTIAEHMGYDGLDEVWAAASVHDVGKIGLLDAILTKSGHLVGTEMHAVKEHPRWGDEIVRHFNDEWDVAPGVRHHHEWLDGRGYPDGLEGENIPMVARIITVADAYDAMTTDRPYRSRMDGSDALNRLSASAGIQFDTGVVEIARECLN